MHATKSIYAAQLRARGFDPWTDPTTTDLLENRLTPSLAPAFLCVTMSDLHVTFAFDECLVLWAVKGVVDLSDLGFCELAFSEDKPPRVLN